MNTIVSIDYKGYAIIYLDDGWFNATQAAAKFGKEPTAWIRQSEAVEYITALANQNGNSGFVTEFNKIKELDSKRSSARNKLLSLVKKTGYVRTKAGAPENGGGTWLHPKLAVPFARWLDVHFAVWCDAQIDGLIRKKDDWRKLRHVSTVSSKSMDQTLYEVRKAAGKDTQSHHYVNEHRLINSLLTGEYEDLDRNALPISQLDFLAHFEIRNSILIGMGSSYEQRKETLKVEALAWREDHAISYPVIVVPTMAPRQFALPMFDQNQDET